MLSNGVSDGTDVYSKSVALQTWFFGYEFPDTIFVLCSNKAYILCSAKKGILLRLLLRQFAFYSFLKQSSSLTAAILKPVTTQKEGRTVDLEIIESSKEGNAANFKTIVDAIKSSNSGVRFHFRFWIWLLKKTIGIIKKDKPKGPFIEPWLKELEHFEQKDIAPNFSDIFAVKDQKEMVFDSKKYLFLIM